MMKTAHSALLLAAIGGAAALGIGESRADPLMGKEPWNFQPVNRAQLAVAIQQVEEAGSGGALGGYGTTIVCGGTSGNGGEGGGTGSGSSATGNSNCIIVNGGDGNIIQVDQDSDGNQSSNSNAEVATNNSSSSAKGSIDEVAAILGSRK